jgi:hypothetical protein
VLGLTDLAIFPRSRILMGWYLVGNTSAKGHAPVPIIPAFQRKSVNDLPGFFGAGALPVVPLGLVGL